MRLRLVQIDAFASAVFGGNPAAVVPLERWLDDATLQAIAAENNLSETAFLVGGQGEYDIRWMTPTAEVDLCGHATLASGWLVLHDLEPVAAALGRRPAAVLASRDHMAVFEQEDDVRELRPDMARVAALGGTGLIATAPGRDCDFVSRFFAPAVGIPEDPVTGSAHCTLVPYWSGRLRRRRLFARQLSSRGGELWCADEGERVRISGRAVRYLEGTIEVP